MQPCGIYGAVQRDFFFLPGKKKESAGSILTPSTIFDSLVKKKKKKRAECHDKYKQDGDVTDYCG